MNDLSEFLLKRLGDHITQARLSFHEMIIRPKTNDLCLDFALNLAYALGKDIGERYDEWLKDIVNILREGPEAKVADFTKPHSFNCKFITGKTAVEDLEGRKR